MDDDPKVVGFPKPEVPPEELIRRQRVEAERLAELSPGEWVLWIEASVARLGVARGPFEALVKTLVAEKEKARRERKADDERQRREQTKKKEREFKLAAELPEQEREARLDGLARRLGEAPAAVREEFAAVTSPPTLEIIESWPEAVETAALLEELVEQLCRFIVFRHELDATAVALWTLFAWIHAVATHSPLLAVTSPDEPDCGKSTLLGVLHRLTPRPFNGAELTGPALYRKVDCDRPTVLLDEADDLFRRKPDLKHIVNTGWTRGTRIPRTVNGVVYEFDVFCPKVVALKGASLPDTTASRSIVVDLWPKLPTEEVETFLYADSPAFKALRRKLTRWSADHAAALADATPTFPPGFNNRRAANWRLLLAVAEHAGGDWPERAQSAAVRLSTKPAAPSEARQLIWALEELLANRESISSEEVVKMLNADPTGLWCNFRKGGPISQWQVAALLRPFEVYPQIYHPTKRASKTVRGYLKSQFAELFARFPRP